MAKKDNRPNQNGRNNRNEQGNRKHHLHPETVRSIWAVVFFGFSILLALAGFHKAGPAGESLYFLLTKLFGVGYLLLPIGLLLTAVVLIFTDHERLVTPAIIGISVLVLASLGAIEVIYTDEGGYFGKILGSLKYAFGPAAALIINGILIVISILVISNSPIRIRLPENKKKEPIDVVGYDEEEDEEETEEEKPAIKKQAESKKPEETEEDNQTKEPEKEEAEEPKIAKAPDKPKRLATVMPKFKNYVPPPMDLLTSSVEKPTTGDLRANANIIKRTLESFGIAVEMGEINIGPKVTRYTLKPAEGVKLSRITALQSDMALALAAHPIRIEAPIPGKSLVGIEVPNRAAAVVRLGNLLTYQEFQQAGTLGFTLGRDVNGEPIFANIEKMPHLLVAGATGSGKSILVHSLIISLLYKNSPSTLRFVMIDPKRVELSAYGGLPHLAMPVVTENKKALAVFRFAVQEMERRYELLSAAGRRDISSYNEKCPPDEIMPYIVVVVDELADLMTSYGREVEGSIIRLAQMARATGIHLVLSTQRPSVEVITGLIKANITHRIALQVASQIDSRTILDTSGAEDLLGGGDLLYISPQISKPKRIQGAYISEEEINKVTDFIRKNNPIVQPAGLGLEANDNGHHGSDNSGMGGGNSGDGNSDPLADYMVEDDNDELYDEAVAVVAEAKKASASLLQRRLKVGYARAARLLDLMENKGVIGPGDGAKPREVYLDNLPEQTQ